MKWTYRYTMSQMLVFDADILYYNVLMPRSLTDGRRLVYLSFFASFFTNLVIVILHTCLCIKYIAPSDVETVPLKKLRQNIAEYYY